MKRDDGKSVNRYARQLDLEGFGAESIQRLKKVKVCILGCGALGSIVAPYLAGAGTGDIVLADFDTVDISNLQRQVLYSEEKLGQKKAKILADHLRSLNSEVHVEVFDGMVRKKDAGKLFGDMDILAECSDNPDTKLMAAQTAASAGIPIVIGGVSAYQGRVCVLWPDSPDFNDIFSPGGCNPLLPCSQGTVFGPAAGVAASIMAAEILKLIVNPNYPRDSKLISFDLLTNDFKNYRI